MNTIFSGTGFWGKGAGNGPWFEVDFEAGVWSGGSGSDPATITNLMNPAIDFDFAFGTVKSNATNYAIRAANAQSGSLSPRTTETFLRIWFGECRAASSWASGAITATGPGEPSSKGRSRPVGQRMRPTFRSCKVSRPLASGNNQLNYHPQAASLHNTRRFRGPQSS